MVELDRIKLVNPPPDKLTKGEDGLLRYIGPEPVLEADAGVRLVSGAIEGSNVSAVDAMVNMIALARQFEAQIKMMKISDEIDNATEIVMRIS